MANKIFDSELKVMDVLLKEGVKTAKQISDILKAVVLTTRNYCDSIIA